MGDSFGLIGIDKEREVEATNCSIIEVSISNETWSQQTQKWNDVG